MQKVQCKNLSALIFLLSALSFLLSGYRVVDAYENSYTIGH
jgi:hypothetical protein